MKAFPFFLMLTGLLGATSAQAYQIEDKRSAFTHYCTDSKSTAGGNRVLLVPAGEEWHYLFFSLEGKWYQNSGLVAEIWFSGGRTFRPSGIFRSYTFPRLELSEDKTKGTLYVNEKTSLELSCQQWVPMVKIANVDGAVDDFLNHVNIEGNEAAGHFVSTDPDFFTKVEEK